MKLELKEYQEDAAARVLNGLRNSSRDYQPNGEHAAVSLSAPTGAGKTVIAAAVIERMFYGDPDGDEPGDPDAVFLWLTDDPSLNEQTQKKILQASGRIQPGDLVLLDERFDQPTFDPGKVYFLNIQKLAKTSNLVVRREGKRTHVLWDTISDTIRKNGSHFYLVIDEAHRGTGRRSADNQTIVGRFLNGDGVVAAPVVLGISATPERFETAVGSGSVDRVLRKVTVPVMSVRESGLIKDVLSISYQAAKQEMEFTLLREAVARLKEIDKAWNAYTEREEEPPVRPALVLQIPASVPDGQVGDWLDVCVEEWDLLGRMYAMAHSLESHTAQQFGQYAVRYVAPQNIQDNPSVRLVLFKEALTTGWDCPRAEVMVSLRTAKDDTYIAQLIGRMVRSPLARRIESDERLNRVRLYLPNFDRKAVEAVKAKLESDDGGIPTDVEISSVDAPRNKNVDSSVFALLEKLPSYQVPGPVHRSQVTRLHKLAALLTGDKVLSGAIGEADAFLVSVLDEEHARLETDGALGPLIKDVEKASVEMSEFQADKTIAVVVEEIDTAIGDLDRLFVAAGQKLRDGLAKTYWGHLVMDLGEDPTEAKIRTIALSSDLPTVNRVESEAGDRVRQWLDTHGDTIAGLSEDKKAKYAEVRAMARKPELVHPGLPSAITMPGDKEVPEYENHIYSDATGKYRAVLGAWERHVLQVEGSRADFVGWYRNPTGGQRALRVPYEVGTGGFGRMYPDFVIVQADDNGELQASIIDPHGHHLADAADKLRGLAAYAEKHQSGFARVVGLIQDGDGEFRMLDLKDPTIQMALEKVHGKESIEGVFAAHGSVYG